MFERLKTNLVYLRGFIERDFWLRDLSSVPPPYRPFLFLGRFFHLVFVDFAQKKAFMMSSSLSYATVLGMVPLVVVAVAMSKGFLQERVDQYAPKAIDYFIANVAPVFNDAGAQSDGGRKLRGTLNKYVEEDIVPTIVKLDLKEIGAYGLIGLIIIAFSLMRTVEEAFNDIWGVETSRSYFRLLLRYWMVIALFPLAMLAMLWLTGFGLVQDLLRLKQSFGIGRAAIAHAGNLIPLWVIFAVVYKFIPYTNVRLVPALVGGVVGGTLWQLNNFLSFMFVSKALQTHYLYGSFGIIPILLMTLYMGWLIVLFGAHVSFAAQNLELFRNRLLARRLTSSERQEIALLCVALAARRFVDRQSPPDAAEISVVSGLPEIYFEDSLKTLVQERFLIQTGDSEPRFAMAGDPAGIHVKDILDAVAGRGGSRILLTVSGSGALRAAVNVCEAFRDGFDHGRNPSLLELAKELEGV